MSVQINCNRCGENTRLFFLSLDIVLARGCNHNVNSKVSPATFPWRLDWHLCESCGADLRRWSEPPPREAVP